MTPPTARAIKPTQPLSPTQTPLSPLQTNSTTQHPRISPKTAQKPKPNMQLTREKGTKPNQTKIKTHPWCSQSGFRAPISGVRGEEEQQLANGCGCGLANWSPRPQMGIASLFLHGIGKFQFVRDPSRNGKRRR